MRDSADAGPGSRRRLYPAVVVLTALAIGFLGLYPHLRFSLESGSPEYFFYSYDEGFYTTLGLRPLPGRVLSALAIRGLIAACAGNLELALIAADFLFPAIAALLAGLLAAAVVRSLLSRLALLLALLFTAELATHLFTTWIPIWSRLVQGPWRHLAVEAQPILYLFRTPEPQISWAVAFAYLAVLVDLHRDSAPAPRRRTALFLGLAALVGLCYVPVLAGCAALTALAAGRAAWAREWRRALRLAAGVAIAGAAGAAAAFFSAPDPAGALLFATSLPAWSPLTILSAGVVALWGLRLALRRRLTPRGWLGLLASLTPVLMMNQQLMTGTAVSFKIWEESANHLFAVLGLACLVAETPALRGPAPAALRLARPAAALLVAAALLSFAVRRQLAVWHWFHAQNAEEAAAARLLDANYAAIETGGRVLFDGLTMDQRLAIRSRNAYRPVLAFDRAYLQPVPSLDAAAERTGPGSPHAEAVYEVMHRRGVEPERLEAMLYEELGGNALVLSLFFSFRDAWGPATTWRARRAGEIRARIPAIVGSYRDYRRRAPPGAPVYRVSFEPPESLQASEDFDHRLLDRRQTVDGRTLYLYRQSRRD